MLMMMIRALLRRRRLVVVVDMMAGCLFSAHLDGFPRLIIIIIVVIILCHRSLLVMGWHDLLNGGRKWRRWRRRRNTSCDTALSAAAIVRRVTTHRGNVVDVVDYLGFGSYFHDRCNFLLGQDRRFRFGRRRLGGGGGMMLMGMLLLLLRRLLVSR
jgi:hypothetical protein